jgi:hypothetical protein
MAAAAALRLSVDVPVYPALSAWVRRELSAAVENVLWRVCVQACVGVSVAWRAAASGGVGLRRWCRGERARRVPSAGLLYLPMETALLCSSMVAPL